MSLFLDIGAGETIIIGGNTAIRLEYKTGAKARLAIDAPRDVSVDLQGMTNLRRGSGARPPRKVKSDK